MEYNGREINLEMLSQLMVEINEVITALHATGQHATARRLLAASSAVFPPRKREPVIQTTVESYNAYGHPIFRR